MTNLPYRPDLSPEKIRENLSQLITPGVIHDRDMQGRIARLRERFNVYAATCPLGLWAPGLAITGEDRTTADIYLPMAELFRAFNRLLALALQYTPPAPASAVQTAATWPDALHELQPHITGSDPAALLQRLMADQTFRTRFLFALFLPQRHGGNFNRYPEQSEYILSRLKSQASEKTRALRCLDTACATGESTYELALLLMNAGVPPDSFLVHGSTLDPLELFAAAHIYFPHDLRRQESFRRLTEPVFASGAHEKISFFTDNITRSPFESGAGYDIILCNGLLGGPRFSESGDIEIAVAALRARLNDGGVVLAADRFHGGWKKRTPPTLLQRKFTEAGFRVQQLGVGLVAEKR